MDVCQAGGPKLAGVVRSVSQVDDEHSPPGLQDPNDLPQYLVPLLAAGDVVDHEAGGHDVERGVAEGQVPGVGIVHVNVPGHAGSACVGDGSRRGVVPLVLLAPDVDADRVAAGQVSSRLDEEEPVAAPDVEDHLVTSPREGAEQAPSGADLADGAAPQVAGGVRDENEAGPAHGPNGPDPHPHPNSNEAGNAGRHQGTWGVEPVAEAVAAVRVGWPCHGRAVASLIVRHVTALRTRRGPPPHGPATVIARDLSPPPTGSRTIGMAGPACAS